MADRVGIELSLLGYDGVFSDAKKLQEVLNNISKTKYKIQFDTEIHRLETELRRLQTKKTDVLNTTKDRNELSALNKKINETKTTLLNLKQMGKNAIFTDQTWERYFNRMQAKMVQTGSRMRTLGKAISSITNPFTRFFSGMVMGAGYAALNKITSGFSGMFERYDTMRNYSRTLEALGYESNAASKSIEALNEAVLGLPTGLDEIVAAQKVYVGATGDLTKATDLAIAANNTFLASGTQSREQRFIQKYLTALGSGAELTTTQWQSMARIAPLAMRAVSEELGYAKNEYADFNAAIQKGNISNEKFLEAFIKVGKSGVVADAANVMKMSWEGLSANLTNATKRMGESALKALDEVFVGYNGRTLLQNLLGVDANGNAMGDGIKDYINSLSTDLQNWIKANPGRITEFFENLKKIDVAGMIKGIAEASANMAEIFVKLAPMFGSGFGKFVVYGSALGRLLTASGGFVKGFAGVATKLAKFSMKGGGGGLLAGLFGGVAGLFGRAKSFFGSGQNYIESAFESAGGVGKAAATMATGWAGVANKALTIAAIPVIALSLKAAISALKDLGEVNISWDRFARNGTQLVTVVGVFGAIAGVLGAFPVAAAAVATGAGAMAAVGVAMASVADGLDKISKMQVPSPDTINRKLQDLKKIIKPLNDIIGLFDQGGIFANIHKALQNFSTIAIMASLEKIVDAVEGVSNKAKALGKLKIGPKTLDKVTKVRKAFEPIGEQLQGLIDDFSEGGFWANIGKRLTNWSASGIVKSLGDMATTVQNVFGAVKLMGSQTFDPLVTVRASAWLTGLEQLVAAHYPTMARWSENRMMTDLANYKDTLKTLGESFGMFGTLLEHFDNIVMTFRKYQESGSFTMGDPFGSVRNRIDMITNFAEELAGEGGPLNKLSLLSQNIDTANVKEVTDVMREIGQMISAIAALSYQLQNSPLLKYNDSMGGMSITALKGTLEGLVPDIISILTSFDQIGTVYTLEGKVAAYNRGLEKIGEMFTAIRNLAADVQGGIFTEVEQIKAAISQATSIGAEGINVPLHIQFDTDFGDSYNVACESIRNVVNAIIDYTKMLDASVVKPINVRFYANIEGLSATLFQINEARRAIRSAINRIPTSVTRRVRINVSPTNVNPDLFHNGGFVQYRAGGGNIFRPRGTDTVPAMLTPGEWVMNRRAVREFGTRFMDRVNALDINGAIRALHTRVGSGMTSTRRTVINNNTTDNRTYSNVQNINTNNPNFAFRRSRWVSELR